MTEPAGAQEGAGATQAPSAGELLRQARMAQGVHIAALAAMLKVAPRKLELLEADRIAELPDTAFARALAQAVCKQLKLDPAPVLARMPLPAGHRLDQGRGAEQSASQRVVRVAPGSQAFVTRPIVWGPGVILLAALALYLVPSGTRLPPHSPAPAASAVAPDVAAPATPKEAASAAVSAPAAVAETLHSVPAASAPEVAAAAAPLVLRSTAPSWVGVVDATGRTLLSRTVQPGETVALDGALPLRVRVGNVVATQITFRGKPVELPPSRENTARIELK